MLRKRIAAAVAALLIGAIALPGCFFVPPWYWGPDHDERWEGRHHERHGALMQQDTRPRRNERAPGGGQDGRIG